MTDDDTTIVNLEQHRDALFEAEIDAEVRRIMEGLVRRDVGVVKMMTIATSFHVQCIATFARDAEAVEVLIRDAQRYVREGVRYYFAKRRSEQQPR